MREQMGLETEIKLEISADDPPGELERVLGKAARKVEQLNRYFLPARPPGTMVRLREEDGGLLLTVKGSGTTTDSGIAVRPEWNEPVPPEWLFDLASSDGSSLLFRAEIMERVSPPLRYAGQTHNTRWMFGFNRWTLELDRTTYPDGSVTWETEVETEDTAAALEELKSLLARTGITYRPAREGKFSRLLKRGACLSPPPGEMSAKPTEGG